MCGFKDINGIWASWSRKLPCLLTSCRTSSVYEMILLVEVGGERDKLGGIPDTPAVELLWSQIVLLIWRSSRRAV